MRRAGVVMVRWGARDVLDPGRADLLAVQLHRERAAAASSRSFRGRIVVAP
jgi:hypothetical protein